MLGLIKFFEKIIEKYIDRYLDQMSSREYNKDGEMISSSFFYKVDSGHFIKIKSITSEPEVSCEHFRTWKNFNSASAHDDSIDVQEVLYNNAHIFKKRYSSKFEGDVISETPNGLFIVRK
jgi:hypothetical protein